MVRTSAPIWIQRAGQLWPYLVEQAEKNETATYGDAGEHIGIHHRIVRHALGPIQRYCLNSGLPILTALVVRRGDGLQGNGFLGRSDEIGRVLSFDWKKIENPFSTVAESDLNKLARRVLRDPSKSKEVFALIRTRGDEQRIFRKILIKAYRSKCAVCGTTFLECLEASHIIPWSGSKPEMRIDPRNGILLCSLHHNFFDKSIINIGPDYTIHFKGDGRRTEYGEYDRFIGSNFDNNTLYLPIDPKLHPKKEWLRERAGR
ncbi:HNH endonuclease [Aurantimonas marianensis]|uniref:HNH endonuclease n=1 Tax=Aurantimonas marianensis TaxID=2920428 RepID=A0A9X2HD31_9HYPH|nr:HNH endonuclease [Aurantimonas marianensis]MCP3056237.1 HNH endonuclease [Aurantimonas marianensis]